LRNPSIRKFDHEFTYSGLNAALGHEPFGGELKVERLGPNGASKYVDLTPLNTLPYMQIGAVSFGHWVFEFGIYL
jgi:hypothetical protein